VRAHRSADLTIGGKEPDMYLCTNLHACTNMVNSLTRLCTVMALAALTLIAGGLGSAAAQDASSLDIHGGTIVFDVGTNVSAISVRGKSTALEGRADIHDSGQGLTISHVAITIPVNTLETGMSLRDSHMRKYVFTTSDGQVPDVEFDAANTTCAANGGGGQLTCQVTGDLAIRGLPRPFTMTLKVKRDGSAFHAAGDALVKLSVYNIDRPSQLGVQTADEVKLHLEFAARPSPTATAANRSGR
jgi:polyisoprenoid-binding protein YceI